MKVKQLLSIMNKNTEFYVYVYDGEATKFVGMLLYEAMERYNDYEVFLINSSDYNCVNIILIKSIKILDNSKKS